MILNNRFHAATKVAKLPSLESTFTDETRLLLYALKSQAMHGPTEIKSKWHMTREERGKYETWANLGKMSNFEAMRLYVKLLEEEDKYWYEAIDEETMEIKENFGKVMTEEERMNSNNASACAQGEESGKVGGSDGEGEVGNDDYYYNFYFETTVSEIPTRSDVNRRWIEDDCFRRVLSRAICRRYVRVRRRRVEMEKDGIHRRRKSMGEEFQAGRERELSAD